MRLSLDPLLFLFLRRSPTRAVKELADGGMVHVRELGHGAYALHLAFGEDGDAVSNLPQQVEVVSNHDYGQAKHIAQLAHQFVDTAGAGRIETRSEEHKSQLQSLLHLLF